MCDMFNMPPESISSLSAILSAIGATASASLAIITFFFILKHKKEENQLMLATSHYQMLSLRIEAVSNDLTLLKYYDVNDSEIGLITKQKSGFLHILQRHVHGYYRFYIEEVNDDFADHIMEMQELKTWWPIQRKIIDTPRYVDCLDKAYKKFHGKIPEVASQI